MQIWPAIDLLGGNCVRLEQGDYERDTIFSDNPAAIAARWFDEGATYLHCVDLDGARSGSIVNESAIREIVAVAGDRPVQLGGGVRHEKAIQRLLGLGLSRLVIGTAALKDPPWFAKMCDIYRGHLVLGLDARDGMVATAGWLETSSTPAAELVANIQLLTENVVAVVYTDIARDGMMNGPNFEAIAAMQRFSRIPVVASGGVTSLEDIDQLVRQNTHAAIVGRSLYTGHMRLPDVLQHASIDFADNASTSG